MVRDVGALAWLWLCALWWLLKWLLCVPWLWLCPEAAKMPPPPGSCVARACVVVGAALDVVIMTRAWYWSCSMPVAALERDTGMPNPPWLAPPAPLRAEAKLLPLPPPAPPAESMAAAAAVAAATEAAWLVVLPPPLPPMPRELRPPLPLPPGPPPPAPRNAAKTAALGAVKAAEMEGGCKPLLLLPPTA